MELPTGQTMARSAVPAPALRHHVLGQRGVFQAEERVKVATILPASWRKRCSTIPGTSLDGGAVSSGCFTAERVTRRSGRHQLGGQRLQMGSERALRRDRPHFHPRSVIEARHALCSVP
jgi:hypothetical protein